MLTLFDGDISGVLGCGGDLQVGVDRVQVPLERLALQPLLQLQPARDARTQRVNQSEQRTNRASQSAIRGQVESTNQNRGQIGPANQQQENRQSQPTRTEDK